MAASLATAKADAHDLSVDRPSARQAYGPGARSPDHGHGVAWLAEVGAHSPLVDDLARAVHVGDWPTTHALGECLSVDAAIAN